MPTAHPPPQRRRQANSPTRPAAIEERLGPLLAALRARARAAGLEHFRYCACSRRCARTASEFRQRLASLERDLAESLASRPCPATVLEQLQELARLAQVPADLPRSEARAARSLIADTLLEFR